MCSSASSLNNIEISNYLNYEPKFSGIFQEISHNIFRIQDNESIMCGFYCIFS